MKQGIALAALVVLAGCDVPQAPVSTGADGQERIQINTGGLTCYMRKCLDIDPTARSVRQIGNRVTGIPGNINVSDGTITPAEFQQLGIAASLVGGMGSGGENR